MKQFKLVLIFLFSILCSSKIHAQINFEHGTWAEIKAKAKAEHKLIFMDAYTTWCGPCKMLAKNVFTNDMVSQYYNATFVNVTIDMEAGEGKDLAKLYDVKVYPTLLFINEDGELVHRAAGAKSSVKFLQLGKDELLPEKQFGTLEKKYKNGARDVQFMKTYLDAMQAVSLSIEEPLNEYFNTQKEEYLTNRENWNIINAYVDDYQSKEFKYFIKNKDLFATKYTLDTVNNKLFNVYRNACKGLIYKKILDSTSYSQLKEEIKTNIVLRSNELILWSDMNLYLYKKDYLNFAKTAANYIENYKNEDAAELEKVAYNFYLHVTDKDMLAKAEKWAAKCYQLKPSPELFMDTYACLLFVNGKKQDAIQLQKRAIELIKADPQKYNQDDIPELEEKIAEWSK